MQCFSEYANKQVLITSGLGFIGSNLAIRLVNLGARVTLVDSMIPTHGGNLFNIEPVVDRVRISLTDIRDSHGMEYLLRGQDYLFNLAGQVSHIDSMNDPFTDLAINTASHLSILESVRRNNRDIKIVFTSTRQIYGKPQYVPVDEKHPINPADVNGVTNFAGESLHTLYYDVYGIRSCILRLTNTYGPRQLIKHNRQGFIAWFVHNILLRRNISVFGDGRQLRDLNHVEDVADALLLSGLSPKADGQTFNLGASKHISLIDLAQLMVAACGHDVPVETIPFPAEIKKIDIGDYYADYRKIRETLGWEPRVDLADGLRHTFDYYKQHRAHYLQE